LLGTGSNEANNNTYFDSLDANVLNSPAGELGGATKHTLTTGELPQNMGSIKPLAWASNNAATGMFTAHQDYSDRMASDGSWLGTATYTLGGNGWAHSNMPPYLSVFMWKRIAVDSYITSGLVFHLDCSDMNYTSGVWTDRIGGYSFSMHGVTRGSDGGVTFTRASSTYGEFGSLPTFASSSCTIEYVFKMNSLTNGLDYMMFINNSSASMVAACYRVSDISYLYTATNNVKFACSAVTAGKKCTFSGTGNGTTAYINKSAVSSGGSDAWTGTNSVSYLGKRNSGDTAYFDGELYQIRIYNRQLTQAEMLANQTIDMSTYGIA
jgi:hypothetical protein